MRFAKYSRAALKDESSIELDTNRDIGQNIQDEGQAHRQPDIVDDWMGSTQIFQGMTGIRGFWLCVSSIKILRIYFLLTQN